MQCARWSQRHALLCRLVLEPCGQGAFLLETEVTELFELKSLHASTDRCPTIPSGRVPALLVTMLRLLVDILFQKSPSARF